MSVLNKGLNFVPTPKRVDDVDFITEIEKLISKSDMSEDDAAMVRFETTKALQAFKRSSDNLTADENAPCMTLERGRIL